MFCINQLSNRPLANPPKIGNQPIPDVRVQEQSQSRRTSQSSSSVAGEIMSPRVSPEPCIEPIHDARSSTTLGGTISAMGLPRRVMRSVFLVLRTRSSKARRLALNSEMATSSMADPYGQQFRL